MYIWTRPNCLYLMFLIKPMLQWYKLNPVARIKTNIITTGIWFARLWPNLQQKEKNYITLYRKKAAFVLVIQVCELVTTRDTVTKNPPVAQKASSLLTVMIKVSSVELLTRHLRLQTRSVFTLSNMIFFNPWR